MLYELYKNSNMCLFWKFSCTKFVFSKHWNVHLSIYYVADLLWQRSRAVTSPVTPQAAVRYSYFIMAVYHSLFQDWQTQINVMRVRRSGSLKVITEPTEHPAGRHKEPKLSHHLCCWKIDLVVGLLIKSLEHYVIHWSLVHHSIGAKLNQENIWQNKTIGNIFYIFLVSLAA